MGSPQLRVKASSNPSAGGSHSSARRASPCASQIFTVSRTPGETQTQKHVCTYRLGASCCIQNPKPVQHPHNNSSPGSHSHSSSSVSVPGRGGGPALKPLDYVRVIISAHVPIRGACNTSASKEEVQGRAGWPRWVSTRSVQVTPREAYERPQRPRQRREEHIHASCGERDAPLQWVVDEQNQLSEDA